MTAHRLEETAHVLIRAYLRGELKHGTRCECAVGNVIAAYNPNLAQNAVDFSWRLSLVEEAVYLKEWVHHPSPYSARELGKIEQAFEARRPGSNLCHLNSATDPDSFIGLTNVFDLLCNELDRDYFEVGDILKVLEEERMAL